MRTFVVINLTLFLASAIAGALISYNPPVAWQRFTLIAIGLTVLIVLMLSAQTKSSSHLLLDLVFAILPAFVIFYFILTNDWTSRLGKLSWLDPFMRALGAWQPMAQGVRINSNSFGGVVAELIPLQIAALAVERSRLTWLGIVLIPFSLIGLFLSESRGAWFALAAVVGAVIVWTVSGRVARHLANQRVRQIQIAMTVGVLFLVALIGIILALSPFGENLLQVRNDRVMVWKNSTDLASDYFFTGVGLGGFDMAYSSYVLLLHVVYVNNASNLFLDVWIEQGLLGLTAFVGLIVSCALPILKSLMNGKSLSRWQIGAFAALGVVLLHGLVDDPFYGYGGIAIPFLFVPFGLLARQNSREASPAPAKPIRVTAISRMGLSLALLVIALLPASRAAFVANLGALNQTRAELFVYHWPTWSVQDEVRRSNKIDLSLAIEEYKAALAIDPHNATANRRLGQLMLSLGEYDQARTYLLAAYASAPDQRATRQMLGEAEALSGDVNDAARLWNSIDVSEDQIGIREWWYEYIGEPQHAALLKMVGRAGE